LFRGITAVYSDLAAKTTNHFMGKKQYYSTLKQVLHTVIAVL
jgi:hypothetical protein